MTTELATLDVQGRIARLTLNRPEARNALSIDLLSALRAHVERLHTLSEQDDRPTVVVMTGAGKAFCAGMDLKAVLGDPAAPPKLLGSLAELCVRLRALPMVLVARVNGAAIGGGCGLTCVCDVSVTHADAKLGYPEVDLGVCPAVVAPWLVRKIGAGRARAVLLRGGIMSGTAAAAIGLVDELVPSADDLDAATEKIATRMGEAGPKALAATKGLLNTLDGSLDEAMSRRGAELSAGVLADPNVRAGLAERFR